MQKVEAWKTEDGAVFADAQAAAVHEFRAYATRVFDEAAVALILADPIEIHRRLSALLAEFKGEVMVFEDARPQANGFERKARPNRVGQFTIPTHIAPDVVAAILTVVEIDGFPPPALSKDGTKTAYVGRSDSFDGFQAPAGSPPPSYDWSCQWDEKMKPVITWSRRP